MAGVFTAVDTALPKMVPPVKPTSDPGVGVVVKSSARAFKEELIASIENPPEILPCPSRLSKVANPGKVMLTLCTSPPVTSTVSVPENMQIAPEAQVPMADAVSFVAIPDTLNTSALATAGATTRAATSNADLTVRVGSFISTTRCDTGACSEQP